MADEDVELVLGLLPRSYFFSQEPLPRNYEEGVAYIQQLERTRAEATATPLSSLLPREFTPSDAWTESVAATSTTKYHRVSPFPDVLLSAARPQDMVITVSKPIRAQVDTFTQVYLGTLRVGAGKPRSVCLKIYQQSLCQFPKEDCFDENDDWSDIWRSAAQTAAIEAWAYRQLKSFQGSLIPYSFGFYKIRLPNDEISIVHVLEYLDAIRLSDLDRATIEQRVRCDIFDVIDDLLSKLDQMHAMGVVHGDINWHNVMLMRQIPDDDPSSALVVIDFNLAQPSDESNKFHDAVHTVELFRKLNVPMKDIEEWYMRCTTSTPRPQWLSMFCAHGADNAYFNAWQMRTYWLEI
ncbi:hypothetical protein PUNSTDRAFT_138668 [Punctularia strigosozonata HHB-11173 SS5]|uniref:Protein kinase domain-containing protein n=1 Tax=Punctularia strigosozonata (strain HHB-11173) TaxID=741275 RepID=R7S256_PUNST|nr:uncharacterized protein PUNSTDRAFT_138668 [Punctularia strigosozonata HHB-11173 SS5]EIN04273.1 hypothetical protein PUNSTDRAFT_138668 [Punctularia strigosozonata HHB-11173 SS5]